MMKKAWLTAASENLYSLTLESEKVDTLESITSQDEIFPKNPTAEHPLRRVSIIRYLTEEDLINLYDTLGSFLISMYAKVYKR